MVFYICEVASIKNETVQQAIAKIGENVLKRFIPIYIKSLADGRDNKYFVHNLYYRCLQTVLFFKKNIKLKIQISINIWMQSFH